MTGTEAAAPTENEGYVKAQPCAPQWVDAHGHLASPKLTPAARKALIEEAQNCGAQFFIQGGVDPDDWRNQRSLAQELPGRVGIAVGLHPEWVSGVEDSALQEGLRAFEQELTTSRDITAWGE